MGSKRKKGKELSVSAPKERAGYFRENRSQFLKTWRPALRETSDDIGQAWYDSAARAVESLQNSGFIAGVADVCTAQIVGSGLNVAVRPDFEALGWTEEFARNWSGRVESRWYSYSSNPQECDAAGRMTHGQMQQAVIRSWLAFGETFALLPMFRRPSGSTLSKIALLPPSRLVMESDGQNLVQGVRVDRWGAPLAYKVRVKDTDLMSWRDVEYRAFDRDGRYLVAHIFDPLTCAPRGISPLAPVIKVLRQVDQYADATLTSAMIQTIFAATVKTGLMGDAAFAGLRTADDQKEVVDLDGFAEAKIDWYENAKIDLFQHGRIGHLMPGDELEFHASQQSSQNYDGFMAWLIREIARCAGVTYESATGDYRGATYSSVRMATAEQWNIVLQRRSNIAVPFCQITYQNWLEEEIGSGRIEFPGGLDAFYANRVAATGALWTGPARPQADDLKTARAHEVLHKLGVTTWQQICADYGLDWREVADQRAAEKEYALSKGLPDPHIYPESKAQATGTEDRTDDPSFAG